MREANNLEMLQRLHISAVVNASPDVVHVPRKTHKDSNVCFGERHFLSFYVFFYCMTDASPSFGCMTDVISKVDYPKQWRVLTVDAEDDEFYPLLETHLEALFNTKVSLSVEP